jgi:hypothetical protein
LGATDGWRAAQPSCLTARRPGMFEATGLSDDAHKAFGWFLRNHANTGRCVPLARAVTPAEGAGIDHENDQVS